MDPKFQTTFRAPEPQAFIPKKPLAAAGGREKKSVNFFSLIGSVVFTVALLAAAAVFGYTLMLEKWIKDGKETLARAQNAFDPALVETLSTLDSRIEGAKEILSNHRAISAFFDLLETLTLRSVRFKSFDYVLVGKDKVNVTMKGEGESFSSIALQSDVFTKSKFLVDPVISNLTLEQNGNVAFDFTASIDPSVVLYKNKANFGATQQ